MYSLKKKILIIWTILSQRLAELEEQQNDSIKTLTQVLVEALTSTAFFVEIMAIEIPKNFSIPKFQLYEGTHDPMDHILHARQVVALYENNDALMCWVLPTNLIGSAPE